MKKLIGIVLNDKMDKTKVVEVTRVTRHPLYHKLFKKSKKFLVDDEKGLAKVGDVVEITETKPLSKNKSFKITKVEENK